MEPAEATRMLANDYFNSRKASQWADLGCGSGVFTLALAGLLQPQSVIYAVDKDASVLQKISSRYDEVRIEKIAVDFDKQRLSFENLDGILMANSLHYVKDKPSFIRDATTCLSGNGCFLIVEYDTRQPNRWVPYPVDLASLTGLFNRAGFSSVQKIGERLSLFGRAKLYSAIIRK